MGAQLKPYRGLRRDDELEVGVGDASSSRDVAARAERELGPVPAPSPEPLVRTYLSLLDGFQLEVDDHQVQVPLGAQRLVAFLSVHERPLSRSYIAGALWHEKTEERSQANLRSALWRLRRPAGHLVESRGAHLRLAPSVLVDFHLAMRVARALVDGSGSLPEPGDDVLPLLGGELLPDWYDDWLLIERERLRQLRVHALEAYCVRLADAGRMAEAIEVGLTAVAADPLRESARRALIMAHLAEGNAAEAIRQYVSYRSYLFDQVGAAPTRELEELVSSWVDLANIDGPERRRDELETAS